MIDLLFIRLFPHGTIDDILISRQHARQDFMKWAYFMSCLKCFYLYSFVCHLPIEWGQAYFNIAWHQCTFLFNEPTQDKNTCDTVVEALKWRFSTLVSTMGKHHLLSMLKFSCPSQGNHMCLYMCSVIKSFISS